MILKLAFCFHSPASSVLSSNLESASFVVIMLLYEGLTHIQFQIQTGLLFGESFTLTELMVLLMDFCGTHSLHIFGSQ